MSRIGTMRNARRAKRHEHRNTLTRTEIATIGGLEQKQFVIAGEWHVAPWLSNDRLKTFGKKAGRHGVRIPLLESPDKYGPISMEPLVIELWFDSEAAFIVTREYLPANDMGELRFIQSTRVSCSPGTGPEKVHSTGRPKRQPADTARRAQVSPGIYVRPEMQSSQLVPLASIRTREIFGPDKPEPKLETY